MDAHHGDRRARRAARLAPLGWLILLPLLGGASHRTTNFVVWRIHREWPDRWPKPPKRAGRDRPGVAGPRDARLATPCPVRVKLTRGEAGGLTSFGFDKGRVTDQEMMVEGRLDRILASALPHEITQRSSPAISAGPCRAGPTRGRRS